MIRALERHPPGAGSRAEAFVFKTFEQVTGQGRQQLLGRIFRGARIVVDEGGNGLVRGWALGEEGRTPFVFVSHPWHTTAVGVYIREELLKALEALKENDGKA